ncbi:MAG: helix-turn-helix domain-containing protein [Lachnospiraceae bacterium]|nr:helix-turn-helix domain-containing protein [Lachnospiraceae bacterium]
MNLEIANRLVALRKENQLSQEALAEKLGISRQAVSKWERAEASPDTDNLIALARLYHVSLDELLKIHEEEEDDGGYSDREETRLLTVMADDIYGNGSDSQGQTGRDEEEGRANETAEDEVHIGFRGIHVKEHGGDEVYVGWDGIHVHNRSDEVHIDKHGIYVNGEKAEGYIFGRGKDGTEFPLLLIAIVIYIVIGIFFNLWTPGWLIFFLVPVTGSLIQAVRRRNGYLFAYPVLVVFVFLYMGLVHFIWHPTWVVFLTIPLYYSFLGYIQGWSRRKRGEE